MPSSPLGTAIISPSLDTSFPLAARQAGVWLASPSWGVRSAGIWTTGKTLEVNRLCTDGTKNACSFLYAAAARAARAMGYQRIITYTLDTEGGVSLRAAGWHCAGRAGGTAWTGARAPKAGQYPAQMKLRYEKAL